MGCNLFVDGVDVLGFVGLTAFPVVSHYQVLRAMKYIIARDVAFLEDEAWPRTSRDFARSGSAVTGAKTLNCSTLFPGQHPQDWPLAVSIAVFIHSRNIHTSSQYLYSRNTLSYLLSEPSGLSLSTHQPPITSCLLSEY